MDTTLDDSRGQDRIPLGSQAGKMRESKGARSSAAGHEAKVLVIDDEASLRRMLEHILPRFGYRVTAVPSGDLAIAKAQSERFDVVICDMAMPEIGGFDVLRILKETQPSTKVVVVTGYPNSASATVCNQLGAFDYLVKPYEIEDLRAALDRAVESKRLKSGK